ncbi:MAG: hypothetical protein HPY53_09295 [Brevinematales bacterium]|nr:hypothetical protein [Brevinematales bacterium]
MRNRVNVDKYGLESMVRHTISRNPDMRLHVRRMPIRLVSSPLKMNYAGSSSVDIAADVDVRYGADVIKTVEKASQEIRDNLLKLTRVNVKSLEMNVKDIFDEKEAAAKI